MHVNLSYSSRQILARSLPVTSRIRAAEQILREARERQEAEIRPPKQKIRDSSELADYHLRKRKEFRDLIRRVRWNISVWIKYAQWKELQKDFNRARSYIKFERRE